jgi:hypothetical protein
VPACDRDASAQSKGTKQHPYVFIRKILVKIPVFKWKMYVKHCQNIRKNRWSNIVENNGQTSTKSMVKTMINNHQTPWSKIIKHHVRTSSNAMERRKELEITQWSIR